MQTDHDYTLSQAANILGVTKRQIHHLAKLGSLDKYTDPTSREGMVSRTSVHRYLERRQRRHPNVTFREYSDLMSSMEELQEQVAVLQLVIGAPSAQKRWTDGELLLLAETAYNMLALGAYTAEDVFRVTQRIMQLRWQDIARLAELRGPGAWQPVFRLVNDMLRFVETGRELTDKAKLVVGQLERARDFLIGLFGTATHFEMDLPARPVMELVKDLHMPLDTVDEFMISALRVHTKAIVEFGEGKK